MGNKQLSNPRMKVAFKDFEKHMIKHEDQNIKYAVCHMKGWRAYMQDASIHINNFPTQNNYIFGIFDGHGGPQVAEYVKIHFSLQLYVNKKFQQQMYQEALIQTFNKMDYLMQTQLGKKQILEIIKNQIRIQNRRPVIDQEQFAGCTANVCFVTDNEVIVANAGDARCVCYFNGRTIPLSYDHKPKDKPQLKRIKKAGGYVSGGRVKEALNVSRALGDFQYKNNKVFRARQQMITSTPDILKCKRKGLQFIIMGCDGIWQQMSNQQMIAWINYRLQKKIPLDKILDQLLDHLLAEDEEKYTGTDNMSAILIVFKNPFQQPKISPKKSYKSATQSPQKIIIQKSQSYNQKQSNFPQYSPKLSTIKSKQQHITQLAEYSLSEYLKTNINTQQQIKSQLVIQLNINQK